MADIATTEFLAKLKGLYPDSNVLSSSTDVLKNPWWILAAAAFSTGNRPDAVPILFKSVLGDLEKAHEQFAVSEEQAYKEKLTLARKFRDLLLKSGMLSGYSKAINALNALHSVMPKELQDTKTLRNTTLSTAEFEKIGGDFFKSMYGDTAEQVLGFQSTLFPDLGWLTKMLSFGCVYGFTEYTNQLETSYILIGTLIAADTPMQVGWHLANARRGGATLEQARASREIAIEVSKSTGVAWKNQIPDVAA